MASPELTFGSYLRELRGKKTWSLLTLSEKSALNYQHLSRIENDAVVPNADTTVRLAEVLGGDLKLMLELADCLPAEILLRMTAQGAGRSLKRSAHSASKAATRPAAEVRAQALARSLGVPESEVEDIANAMVRLTRLDARKRRAVVQLMKTLDGGRGAEP